MRENITMWTIFTDPLLQCIPIMYVCILTVNNMDALIPLMLSEFVGLDVGAAASYSTAVPLGTISAAFIVGQMYKKRKFSLIHRARANCIFDKPTSPC